MKLLLTVFAGIFLSGNVFAQEPYDKHDIDELKIQAREYYDMYKFNYALDLYLKLDSLDPENPAYDYPIAACYVQAESDKAIPYIENCLKMKDRFDKKLIKYAATAYHLAHKFDLAIKYYEEYKETYQNKKGKVKKQFQKYIDELDLEIQMCKNGLELSKKPLKVEIKSVSDNINSKYPDYGPVLNANEDVLIFTSERPNTTGGKIDKVDKTYSEDIYISYKDENGVWSEPKHMGDSVNTEGEDASVALSPDGHQLLIYRLHKHDLMHHSSGDLFICELEGDHWSTPKRLPDVISSAKYWEPSGSFSADGSKLVFTSDRKDGSNGGTDIWISIKDAEGNWTEPKNLGSNINTKFDEDSPYLHPDGKTLYFCSNGHNTIGGYDIFYSKWESDSNSWGKPKNLGYPINTAHDDIHFTWSADGKRIYFSSIRPEGKGGKDIYFAEIEKPLSAKVVIKQGIVKSEANGMPVNASIQLFNKKTMEELGTYISNSSTGKYTIILTEGRSYHLKVTADNYLPYESDVNENDLAKQDDLIKNILLKSK